MLISELDTVRVSNICWCHEPVTVCRCGDKDGDNNNGWISFTNAKTYDRMFQSLRWYNILLNIHFMAYKIIKKWIGCWNFPAQNLIQILRFSGVKSLESIQ